MLKYPSVTFLSAVLGCALAMAASVAQAQNIIFQSWDVASEFNNTTNPADVWSYGYQTALNNGTFTLLTHVDHPVPPIKGWQRTSNPTKGPFITHNKTNVTQGPFGSAYVVYPPHALALHPGRHCEYADLRFTAPQQGHYRITGQFYAMDYDAGTTTDVYVSVNGVQVYSGQIDFLGGLTSSSFTSSHLVVHLQANDTIDFQVGCGTDGDYFSDSTGLNAVIERQ